MRSHSLRLWVLSRQVILRQRHSFLYKRSLSYHERSCSHLGFGYVLYKRRFRERFLQFGTHPVDWKFQVYCNGPEEHYIDLACPFGKTNSPLEFCPSVALLAKSLAVRYAEKFRVRSPVLGTHVDDIFGGFKSNRSLVRKSNSFQRMDVRHRKKSDDGVQYEA